MHSFQEYLTVSNPNSFFVKPLLPSDIVEICSSLNASKPNGPDDISIKVAKQCIHYYVDPLCDIFNKSLCFGIVPDKLKIAQIIPLHKKNNLENIENYRPIALLSVFAKMLEKIMHKQLYNFLTKYKCIIPEQFGFRKKSFHSFKYFIFL